MKDANIVNVIAIFIVVVLCVNESLDLFYIFSFIFNFSLISLSAFIQSPTLDMQGKKNKTCAQRINLFPRFTKSCAQLSNSLNCEHDIQTRFQKSWDTVQIVNKKGMQ